MRIWLDDERTPPDRLWACATSWSDLERWLGYARDNQIPITLISFDHDLGPDSIDGYECLKTIVGLYPKQYPDRIEVHSANPVGAENIRQYDAWYRRMRAVRY